MASPVRGLRPVVAFLLTTLKEPNPTRRTSSPPFRELVIESKTPSTARAASAFDMSVASATDFTRSFLFTRSPHHQSWKNSSALSCFKYFYNAAECRAQIFVTSTPQHPKSQRIRALQEDGGGPPGSVDLSKNGVWALYRVPTATRSLYLMGNNSVSIGFFIRGTGDRLFNFFVFIPLDCHDRFDKSMLDDLVHSFY